MREIKYRQYYDGKMYHLGSMYVGVGQIGFSDCHYVDLGNYDDEKCKLMQYTGLKDKNGKEIYEGDIVMADGNREIVEYDKYGFLPFTKQIETAPDLYSEWEYKSIEVIGNIYENKELLEEK